LRLLLVCLLVRILQSNSTNRIWKLVVHVSSTLPHVDEGSSMLSNELFQRVVGLLSFPLAIMYHVLSLLDSGTSFILPSVLGDHDSESRASILCSLERLD
jgi:hypothetical protein